MLISKYCVKYTHGSRMIDFSADELEKEVGLIDKHSLESFQILVEDLYKSNRIDVYCYYRCASAVNARETAHVVEDLACFLRRHGMHREQYLLVKMEETYGLIQPDYWYNLFDQWYQAIAWVTREEIIDGKVQEILHDGDMKLQDMDILPRI